MATNTEVRARVSGRVKPLSPNAKTIRALKEARKGKLKRFAKVKNLLADLNPKN